MKLTIATPAPPIPVPITIWRNIHIPKNIDIDGSRFILMVKPSKTPNTPICKIESALIQNYTINTIITDYIGRHHP